ncbi:LAP4 [Candida pseudojiufengensis]|uniref:LAP4 n=1 Tax=Candida pseudojiufengensis TaxID=497109 RepID=UPI002224ED35|nr:LAP4 [Candida pseudojiufengensis]KAI5964058.1 LAP4 [Candida pseudojiufengensis]
MNKNKYGYIDECGSIISITTDESDIETDNESLIDSQISLNQFIESTNLQSFTLPKTQDEFGSYYVERNSESVQSHPESIETNSDSIESISESIESLKTISNTQSNTQSDTPSNTQDDFKSYYESYSSEFIEFMNLNPTTYHVITHFKSLLENNGFHYIKQNKPIKNLKPGFYYTSRNDQCLIAFIIGGKWKPENGSCFVGSHSDALSIKLNPRGSIRKNIDGYELLGVAPYSGSLNKYWLNRELGLAGSVLVKENGKIQRKLINSKVPIAFIPQEPSRNDNENYNPQTKEVPILSYSNEILEPTDEEKQSKFYNRHSLSLLRYICKLSNTSIESIIDFDLDLYDTQLACRGGIENEFIYSSSLDDRLCAFDSIYGLIEFSQRFFTDLELSEYNGLSGIYLANNEEIGSLSNTGAYGGFLIDNLKSIVQDKCDGTINESIANLTTNTIILSSDVTHAMNPNYIEAYLKNNYPLPNIGPSIKFDSNGHVLSDSYGKEFLTRIINNLSGVKLQQFHIRNDSRSGGTIGPILSNGKRGINGAKLIIDVGLPILSMHSIRSIMGYKDVGIGVRFFKETFTRWIDIIDDVVTRD